jgi:hypothetical protein
MDQKRDSLRIGSYRCMVHKMAARSREMGYCGNRKDRIMKSLAMHSVKLLFLLIILSFLTGGEVLAEKPEWQSMAGTVIELGIRDKWGALGSFNADFVATSADGRAAKAKKNGKGNAWCQVRFPNDFRGPATMARGNFSYKVLANGQVVQNGNFEYHSLGGKVFP